MKSIRSACSSASWARSAAVGTWYLRQLEAVAAEFGFDPATPVRELTEAQLNAVLYGTGEQRLAMHFTNQYGRTQTYDFEKWERTESR